MSMILTSGLAHAAEVYQCQNGLPKGESLVSVVYGPNGPALIKVKLHNDGLNEEFDGIFSVTGFESTNGSFIAEGAFKASPAQIKATIQGSFLLQQNGYIYLDVNASGDNRIEYGYGLDLACVRKK